MRAPYLPTPAQDRETDAYNLYMADMGPDCRLLTSDEECQLARSAHTGDTSARDRLIYCNLKLVISIATKYACEAMSLDDCIQEGNIGLMHAVEKFDPDRINPQSGRPYRFSTSATWWIKQAVRRARDEKTSVMRLPVHLIESIRKLRRTEADLFEARGHEPTEQDIARATGWTIDKIRLLQSAAMRITSIDDPLMHFGTSTNPVTLADTLEAPTEESGHHLSSRLREQQEMVLKALKKLSRREREIVRLHHGLGRPDGAGQPLRQVGKQFGVTHERIRQIEKSAIEKICQELARQQRKEKEIAS